ncbi:Hypothetical protein BRADO2649 [Bradyrhizobium sp. ORS 278]|nr:Hypothetical protein BRADO2649 [Bradyrhizobium sp. ORS 278]
MQAAGTTGAAEITRPSLRDGFHAYRALSPVSGLIATVVGGIIITRELDASIGAPGPHAFASASRRSSTQPKLRCDMTAAIAPPRVS